MIAFCRYSCSLREAAPGCAPGGAVPFLCFAKEKEPKERRPPSPVGLGPTALRCSGFAARAELATRPVAAALRQLREVRQRGALRALLQSPALLDGSEGPQEQYGPLLRKLPLSTARLASARRSRAPRADAKRGVRPSPSDELSSAGLCGARDSAHQYLTSGGCLNAASEARVVSSARLAKIEQRKAALAQQGPSRQGSLLCLLSCRYKKGGRPPGRNPGAASRSAQPPRQSETTKTRFRRDDGAANAQPLEAKLSHHQSDRKHSLQTLSEPPTADRQAHKFSQSKQALGAALQCFPAATPELARDL